MSDLLRVLPHFPVSQYASLVPALEKKQVTTTDLLTLEAAEICRLTHLPLLDLKRLCSAVLDALHADLGVADSDGHRGHERSARTKGDGAGAAGAGAGAGAAEAETHQTSPRRHTLATRRSQRGWSTISTLDPVLDASLGGGIPTGYITEIAGEAGAGKTQVLLSLLLAVQLPPPHGTGRRALYISTEAPLSTRRLTQVLTHNPVLASLPADQQRPSLDAIVSTTTPDLESQEHILTYQVPVEVERRDIGLIVLDSVAANYRAEFDRNATTSGRGGGRTQSSNMGARGAELVRLGMLLRDLAIKHNLAVVVSNQVADRFFAPVGSPLLTRRRQPPPPPPPPPPPLLATDRNVVTPGSQTRARGGPGIEDSPLAARSKNPLPPMPPVEPTSSMAEALPRSSMSLTHDGEKEEEEGREEEEPPPTRLPPPPPDETVGPPISPVLTLDHQQRWFTGWGDDPTQGSLKTPSLGLIWATQTACRIALFRAPRYGRSRYAEDEGGGAIVKTWRRWSKVVFAPHVEGTGPGLEGATEFEINMGGLKGIVRGSNK